MNIQSPSVFFPLEEEHYVPSAGAMEPRLATAAAATDPGTLATIDARLPTNEKREDFSFGQLQALMLDMMTMTTDSTHL